MRKLIQLYFLCCLSISTLINAEGFGKNTLIQTPQGLTVIPNLKINDLITLQHTTTDHHYHITNQHNYTTDHYVKIKILDTVIYTAPDQKFYSSTRNAWIQAEDLNSSELLLCANASKAIIDAIEYINKPITLYSLTVNISHAYCVSPYKIIVHNFEPTSTGAAALISLACPPAAPFVITAGAIAGTIITGIGLFSAYKKHKKNKTFAQISEELKNNNSNSPSPKKPDDDEHPHGIYKDAGYHHKNSKQNKSPNPENGQQCLDYSLHVEDGTRIAIENNKFVVLRETLPKEFHGYVVEWKGLHQSMRNVLRKNGYITPSGKIIKQITEKALT